MPVVFRAISRGFADRMSNSPTEGVICDFRGVSESLKGIQTPVLQRWIHGLRKALIMYIDCYCY